ncbi:DNA-binding transcriptional LysR family regulator [Bosea sp. BE271]|uniref:LysR family transcriptional regulator n=1 Tax=Bosea TaxID=85413 RepID=UPI0028574564|nr:MULTISPECIES: LysR family transcriptional regulator [Bosea]MDR6827681.1 DNA-binding transcriptional LysR family regulator [Bosea robiniae]MDR6894625.1 DNA-binding transcriptional LysR family regulator [Bosea sp. BE109]MDR7137787.1 DNA-binding transcriptional LysR family regulator [Bosea sp. BE168]MDR7174486.1 DNA-binding transcriptional LysR family regulator [Bosea sp. BE271]
MSDIDLNLLTALDALLAEDSVTRAGARLKLSPSAMSRTLARLRAATGDPLLVRAGRRLVPTPRALALRDRVHELNREVRAALSPQDDGLDLASLARTFTIRASEGFIALFCAPLITAITKAAPQVRLRFAPKPEKDAAPLRDGEVDLEFGVLGAFAPEIRAPLIFRDRFVGVARAGHPLFDGPLSPQRYAACRHVVASRRGVFTGPVDEALVELGLERDVVAVVPGFPDAITVASQSDLVALVPASCVGRDEVVRQELVAFDLPVRTPEIAISAMWHPRMEADPAHRWMRETMIAACRAAVASLRE